MAAAMATRFMSTLYKNRTKALREGGSGFLTRRNLQLKDLPRRGTLLFAADLVRPAKRNFSVSSNEEGISRFTSPSATKRIVTDNDSKISSICHGCGAWLQCEDPNKPGYVTPEKLSLRVSQTASYTTRGVGKDVVIWEDEGTVEDEELSKPPPLVVCRRCFNLKHYNKAMSVQVPEEDYLRHLNHLKTKHALILLVVDVLDFPASLFPNLYSLLPQDSPVVIVANKTDLLPTKGGRNVLKYLKEHILKTARDSSLHGCYVKDVHFVSAKTGENVEHLSDEVIRCWGNRGDVYLLGCTNVGKSSLFARLATTLCGLDSGTLPTGKIGTRKSLLPTISALPGTTLGLLSVPIMSVGKRHRLRLQKRRVISDTREGDEEAFDPRALYHQNGGSNPQAYVSEDMDTEDVLSDIGLRDEETAAGDVLPKGFSPPLNRHWLRDTPGAVNSEQLITHLTPEELKVVLTSKPLRPRTFILNPGESILFGGLARIDYTNGPYAAYFTVFASSMLTLHPTKTSNVDKLYCKHAGGDLLKVPIGGHLRMETFPNLETKQLTIEGIGWNKSACDVILSSVGWVAVTAGRHAHLEIGTSTPLGKGMHLRTPSLFPDAIQDRGKRSCRDGRRSFRGQVSSDH